MDGRRLKEAMAAGELVVGTMVTDAWIPAIGPILAVAGFDFFVVDLEHGPFDVESLTGMALASRGAGIAPLVRIAWHAREHVQRPLDAGAGGLVAPGVESRDGAERLVRWAKYAPEGERGIALRRAHTAYRRVPHAAYMAEANASTVVVVQIETVPGVERIEEICGVSGVDGVLIGTNDLSVSMGIPGQIDHPDLTAAVEHVARVGLAAGRAVGIHLGDVGSLRRWLDLGMRWLMLSSEVGLLIDAAAPRVQELREGRVDAGDP